MIEDILVERVRGYLSGVQEGVKPRCGSLDSYSFYDILSGSDGVSEDSRFFIEERFFGTYAEAIRYGIGQPEFYGHTRNIENPFNDDPCAQINGYIKKSDFNGHGKG